VNHEGGDMKRTIFSWLLLVGLVGLTGCVTQHGRRPWACMGGSCAQAAETGRSCDAGCGASCDATCGASCDPGGVEDPPKCRRGCRARALRSQPVIVEAEQAPAGPATGAVTYPYYTTRGPRDFLAKNPPSIGP
jgi:hypothetical protein